MSWDTTVLCTDIFHCCCSGVYSYLVELVGNWNVYVYCKHIGKLVSTEIFWIAVNVWFKTAIFHNYCISCKCMHYPHVPIKRLLPPSSGHADQFTWALMGKQSLSGIGSVQLTSPPPETEGRNRDQTVTLSQNLDVGLRLQQGYYACLRGKHSI